jgi:signal transduction histidine kinase
MRTHKKEILLSESMDEIRHDLIETDLSVVSDDEYISLLNKHTSNLVNLLERINKEVEAEESIEAVLSILFEQLHEPVCAINEHAKIIYYNACWKSQFENTRLRHSVADILSVRENVLLNRTLKSAQSEGKRMIYSLREKSKISFISILPFFDSHKKQSFLLTFFRDDILKQLRVNGYKTLEDANNPDQVNEKAGSYQQIPSLQESVLNAIDGFYFLVTKDYCFSFVSPAIKTKLGRIAEDFKGKSVASLFSEDACKRIKEFKSRSNKETGAFKTEVELKDDQQRTRMYELSLTPFNEGREIMGLCLDVQKYKSREQELVNERNIAELNDRLKSDFLANMSHEIRTPLNGIIGFSTMLGRDDLLDEKREKYLRIIHSSTSQLLTIVSDIIDISKIEAGQLKILYNKLDVHQLLEDIQATFVSEAQRLGKKNIKLVKQIEKAGSGLFIKSDEVRLKQVLNNLLGNALKFTNEGEIRFGYSIPDADTIRFFVRDNGIGISKASQKSIFNRFKQTNEGEKDKYKGTGLGLAISKGIVELLGGKIGVQSQCGEGSEFFFTLPLTPNN